eukprot:UN03927
MLFRFHNLCFSASQDTLLRCGAILDIIQLYRYNPNTQYNILHIFLNSFGYPPTFPTPFAPQMPIIGYFPHNFPSNSASLGFYCSSCIQYQSTTYNGPHSFSASKDAMTIHHD